MDHYQVDQTVVTTEPAIAAPTQPDPLWAPDTLPTAPIPVAPVAAPVVPTAFTLATPVAAPVVPAAAPIAAAPASQQTVRTFRHRTVRASFENAELTRRIVVLVFGLIELVIGMRVVLLLLNARTTNGLVSGILNLSGPFVAPFEGILKSNSVSASGSVLDVAALLALAGWAVVEMVAFWIMATFRREPA